MFAATAQHSSLFGPTPATAQHSNLFGPTPAKSNLFGSCSGSTTKHPFGSIQKNVFNSSTNVFNIPTPKTSVFNTSTVSPKPSSMFSNANVNTTSNIFAPKTISPSVFNTTSKAPDFSASAQQGGNFFTPPPTTYHLPPPPSSVTSTISPFATMTSTTSLFPPTTTPVQFLSTKAPSGNSIWAQPATPTAITTTTSTFPNTSLFAPATPTPKPQTIPTTTATSSLFAPTSSLFAPTSSLFAPTTATPLQLGPTTSTPTLVQFPTSSTIFSQPQTNNPFQINPDPFQQNHTHPTPQQIGSKLQSYTSTPYSYLPKPDEQDGDDESLALNPAPTQNVDPNVDTNVRALFTPHGDLRYAAMHKHQQNNPTKAEVEKNNPTKAEVVKLSPCEVSLPQLQPDSFTTRTMSPVRPSIRSHRRTSTATQMFTFKASDMYDVTHATTDDRSTLSSLSITPPPLPPPQMFHRSSVKKLIIPTSRKNLTESQPLLSAPSSSTTTTSDSRIHHSDVTASSSSSTSASSSYKVPFSFEVAEGNSVSCDVNGVRIVCARELQRLANIDTLSKLHKMTNLKVETPYGSVFWNGEIDLTEAVCLKTAVVFGQSFVEIYPNDHPKPSRGKGLNRPATITLSNIIAPKPRSAEKWKLKLQRNNRANDCEFISYSNTEWRFNTKGF